MERSETTRNKSVAPPTQGTWRSNDYVSAVRLVDAWLFYGVGRWTIIYILGVRHKHVRPLSPSHPNITFLTLVGYQRRDKKVRERKRMRLRQQHSLR